jgi:hypothetical protein
LKKLFGIHRFKNEWNSAFFRMEKGSASGVEEIVLRSGGKKVRPKPKKHVDKIKLRPFLRIKTDFLLLFK